MMFQAGSKYRTRAGHKAVIEHVTDVVLTGSITYMRGRSKGMKIQKVWDAKGASLQSKYPTSPQDIISDWPPEEIVVNGATYVLKGA